MFIWSAFSAVVPKVRSTVSVGDQGRLMTIFFKSTTVGDDCKKVNPLLNKKRSFFMELSSAVDEQSIQFPRLICTVCDVLYP